MEKIVKKLHTSEILLHPTRVMYETSKGGVQTVVDTQKNIEDKVKTFKARKCFGIYFPKTGEYRAAVSIFDDELPEEIGLPVCEIPGGKYGRMKLFNWIDFPNLGETIGKAIETMEQRYEYDSSRQTIEFYRSEKELHVLLPVK